MSGRSKIRSTVYGIYNLQTTMLYPGHEQLLKQEDGCQAFPFYNCLYCNNRMKHMICNSIETLLVKFTDHEKTTESLVKLVLLNMALLYNLK